MKKVTFSMRVFFVVRFFSLFLFSARNNFLEEEGRRKEGERN